MRTAAFVLMAVLLGLVAMVFGSEPMGAGVYIAERASLGAGDHVPAQLRLQVNVGHGPHHVATLDDGDDDDDGDADDFDGPTDDDVEQAMSLTADTRTPPTEVAPRPVDTNDTLGPASGHASLPERPPRAAVV